MPEGTCFHCKTALKFPERVGRSETCDKCGYDVHVCYNCIHYDTKAYNECREPMADRVLDKDRRNFCDYYKLGAAGTAANDEKSAALKKLDDLFK